MLKRIGFVVFLCSVYLACDSSTDPQSKYNPPSDHTVVEDGIKHKPGLNNPTVNCIGCHGTDLKGDTGPSCYTCHGKKW